MAHRYCIYNTTFSKSDKVIYDTINIIMKMKYYTNNIVVVINPDTHIDWVINFCFINEYLRISQKVRPHSSISSMTTICSHTG